MLHILFQFLSESVILSVAGGAAGILTGTTGAFILGMLTDFPIRVSSTAVLLSVSISIAVGIFFGAYPAQRASRIEPIKALKL